MADVTVSIDVHGETLMPEAVTALNGVTPTHTRAARPLGPRTAHLWPGFRAGHWGIERKGLLPEAAEAALVDLLAVVPPPAARSVLGAHEVRANIGVFGPRDMGDVLFFSPETLARLAQLEVALVVDVYAI